MKRLTNTLLGSALACLLISAPVPAQVPPPVPPTVRAWAVRPNVFQIRRYRAIPLPTFASSRPHLPQPFLDDHPEWTRLYWKAWELAFQHLKQPVPGSGFVSNFIDPAFNANTFQWDSCFMVLFAHYAEPDFHAIGSFDNFYAKQHHDGFICREISRATGEDVYFGGIVNAVNPPLFSWVEWENYRLTGDKSRFRDVLPPLIRYYRWLQANRRRQNGLYWNTGLGAGEDDLVRNSTAYSWVDMTSQQAQNAFYIARIAEAVGDQKTAAYFDAENRHLARLITQTQWDPNTGFFYDLTSRGKPTGIKTALGFWPLLARVATPAQARSLVQHLEKPNEFWRENVVPALAHDQPGYSAEGQYWNGAVWAPTNYMVIKGLQEYGYEDLASRVTSIYLANMATALVKRHTIWENYAPEHPVGHGVRDMVGWSGDGPIALLLENILGVRADATSHRAFWRPRLPGRNGVRHLTVGNTHLSLVASALTHGRRTLTLTTDRPFTVAVDTGIGKPAVFHLTPGTTTKTLPARSLGLNYRTRDDAPVSGMPGGLERDRPATASSSQDTSLTPDNAVDGDPTTRWSSRGLLPQWLKIDLGAPHHITGVTLHWETANAKGYEIQASSDGQTWTTLYRTDNGQGGTEEIKDVSVRGRYVRLLCKANNGHNANVSLYEVIVHGK